ncbi:MAG TPA: hypothetical protein VG986_15305 [Pseudolabrys sp.]|nr:hypothetical protein [Pseudolabrys sp.]
MVSAQSVAKALALAALAIAVTVASAPAKAEMLPTGVMKLAPGQSFEAIAPAASVVSTSHYQAMLTLTCSFHACSGSFPKIAAKRRLNVTRVSCTITSQNANSVFGTARAELYNATSTLIARQELVHVHTNTAGVHGINDAIDLLALNGQYIYVYLLIANDTATFANCTISGTMDVLG